MNDFLITCILDDVASVFSPSQLKKLEKALTIRLSSVTITNSIGSNINDSANRALMDSFISSKRVEGCSEKSLKYYTSTIDHMLNAIEKTIRLIDTNDLRNYLAKYQSERSVSKVTIDNIRRILSSFFGWLEDEDHILKSPVRRIHRIKADKIIKDTISDEGLEAMRDVCENIRDQAMVDLLASTGMRVGELVRLNIEDIDFYERECVVLGKGNSERKVYFDARTKIHLKEYIDGRNDSNPALFVSLARPNTRLMIGGIEVRIRELGKKAELNRIHPHKFRRTLATRAIDKGMPIEQVQTLLGHVKIDTTMHYAMVNQANVKIAHRRYIG